MKKFILVLLLAMLSMSLSLTSYASDWDVAGKVLTGIAGLRILTGGKVDLLGVFTPTDKSHSDSHEYTKGRTQKKYARRDEPRRVNSCSAYWVSPRTVWHKEYVPGYTKYDPEYGRIFVEGHYVSYEVIEPGYWSYDCSCPQHNRR